jgi:hypothetical protein
MPNPSIALQAITRVQALLAGGLTGIPGGVTLDRASAFKKDQAPAVVIEIDSEDAAPLHNDGERVTLNFSVVFFARQDNWQTTLDQLRVASHSLLIADAALSELVSGLRRTNASWDWDAAEGTAAEHVQRYTCQYYTNTPNL